LATLQKQHLIKIHDGAIVTWPEGKKAPQTRQLVDLVQSGLVGGMFWGLLFGMLFFAPFAGMAIGMAFGALGGAFGDYGINDDFIAQVRRHVTPGTSALFLMSSDAVLDRVAEGMRGIPFEIITTNLSHEQEAKLRAAFGQG
jgi:uncharacterized membrane protein